MISNSPGTIVDITDPDHLAAAMSMWSIAPLNGPSTGPIIGGFVFQYMGWRWDAWIPLILGGAGVLMMLTVKDCWPLYILDSLCFQIACKKHQHNHHYW